MKSSSKIRVILVAIVLVLAAVRYPQVRWFLIISVFLGGIAAVILHFVNKRPVKLEADEVRLHLLDDEPPKKP